MPSEGRPNTGPVDFFYLLKRRNVSFERWCQSVGIQTREDFNLRKMLIETAGEHFFSPELVALGNALPSHQEPTQEIQLVRTPTLPPSALPDPSEVQESSSVSKKAKKQVIS